MFIQDFDLHQERAGCILFFIIIADWGAFNQASPTAYNILCLQLSPLVFFFFFFFFETKKGTKYCQVTSTKAAPTIISYSQ